MNLWLYIQSSFVCKLLIFYWQSLLVVEYMNGITNSGCFESHSLLTSRLRHRSHIYSWEYPWPSKVTFRCQCKLTLVFSQTVKLVTRNNSAIVWSRMTFLITYIQMGDLLCLFRAIVSAREICRCDFNVPRDIWKFSHTAINMWLCMNLVKRLRELVSLFGYLEKKLF